MKSIKKLKIKSEYTNPLMLLVYEYDTTTNEKQIFGRAILKRKIWKKEFEKYYNALLLNNKSYFMQLLTTKDNDENVACELLGEEIIDVNNENK
jgi:hypothetical protein